MMAQHQVPGQQTYHPFAYGGGSIFTNYAPVPNYGHMAFTPTTKAPDWSNSVANTSGWENMSVHDANGQMLQPQVLTPAVNNNSFGVHHTVPPSGTASGTTPNVANGAYSSNTSAAAMMSQPQGIPQRRQRNLVEMNLPDNLLGGTASPPVHLQIPPYQGSSPSRGGSRNRPARGHGNRSAAMQPHSSNPDDSQAASQYSSQDGAPRGGRGGRGGRRGGGSHSHTHSGGGHKANAAKSGNATTTA